MPPSGFSTIYRTDIAFNIELVRLKLEKAGIPCIITNEKLVDILPFLTGQLELKVSDRFISAADQVIKEIDINGMEYDMITEQDDSDRVKEDEKYYIKAIFIIIIVFSLIVTHKYLKLF